MYDASMRTHEMKNRKRDQDTKDFGLEVKSLLDDGSFSGYAAVFGNIDNHGDIITKGAFSRTLSLWEAKGRQVPILWQHDPEKPIGVTTVMEEDERGLRIEGKLFLDVQLAREAHALLKGGALGGLSIGYKAVKADWQGKNRVLKEIKLFENSLVTFPSNESAFAQAKSDEFKAADFNAKLSSIRTRHELSQLRWMLDDTLSSVLRGLIDDAEMDKSSKLLALSASIDQFKIAMLDWMERYCDCEPTSDDDKPEMLSPVLMTKAVEELDVEVKAGKVLSAANEMLVVNAITALSELLANSTPGGLYDESDDEETENPAGLGAKTEELDLEGAAPVIDEIKQFVTLQDMKSFFEKK